MDQFAEIHPDEGLSQMFADGRKVMGFGHRVHKRGDSRVPVPHEHLRRVVAARGGAATELLAHYEVLAGSILR